MRCFSVVHFIGDSRTRARAAVPPEELSVVLKDRVSVQDCALSVHFRGTKLASCLLF